MYEAIAIRSSLKLGQYGGMAESRVRGLAMEYREAIKTVRDRLSNLQGRTGQFWQVDTEDHPDNAYVRLA